MRSVAPAILISTERNERNKQTHQVYRIWTQVKNSEEVDRTEQRYAMHWRTDPEGSPLCTPMAFAQEAELQLALHARRRVRHTNNRSGPA